MATGAAARRQRSGLRGVTKLRRTLRRIHQEMPNRVRPAMEQWAEAIWAEAVATAPQDTGRGVEALSWRVGRDGLSARVGLLGLRAAKQGFHLVFHEVGTKGYPPRNIPPLPAQRFLGAAYDVTASWGLGLVSAAIGETLRAAAAGGGGGEGA